MSDTAILDVLELNRDDFENAVIKNKFIGDTVNDRIVFLNKEFTNQAEVLDVLDEYDFLQDFDAVVFADGAIDGPISLPAILDLFSMNIYAIVVKRHIFKYTGAFNEKLNGMTNYEFVCRAAQSAAEQPSQTPFAAGELTGVYGIACESTKTAQCSAAGQQAGVPAALAYIARRYMSAMKDCGILEAVFTHMEEYTASQGLLGEFREEINVLLNNADYFKRIFVNTAPFFIITGDDTCHGVLKSFALSLAAELIGLGQAVVTSGHEYGIFKGFETLENMQFKAFIGFQAPILEKNFFRKRSEKKFQFWFDNPCFSDDMFHDLTDEYYILCQDDYYAQHIRQFYNVKHAFQLPPAGNLPAQDMDSAIRSNHPQDIDIATRSNHPQDMDNTTSSDRFYDIVFIGTYNPVKPDAIAPGFETAYYEYMLSHPKETFEQGLTHLLALHNKEVSQEDFLQILWSLCDVFRNITNYYRRRVIEAILAAGYKIDVFGDSWNAYDGPFSEGLIRHPSIPACKNGEILSHAKIGLNVMTWHKAGMTERIANIMLSGAVCLSDETVYLRENFKENEEIVLFEPDKPDKLQDLIKTLLTDDKKRECIALAGKSKAILCHTWKSRALDIIKLTE